MDDSMNFRTVLTYALLMLFMMVAGTALSQNLCSSDICVVQFNAGFNEANKVDWVEKLGDCETTFIDIGKDKDAPKTYKIVVVPTIVIFVGGEEQARFQANIMMQMEATRKDIQGIVDEIIYSDF